MASNEDIIREAEYYLNNDVNIDKASEELGVSRRTFQLHMKKLESIAPDKFKLVQDKKASNARRGSIKGGSLGKRSPKWTKEDATRISKEMVNSDFTYEDAEKQFGIPRSTLHEMMQKGVEDEITKSLLYAIAQAHKKGMSYEELMVYLNKNDIISPNFEGGGGVRQSESSSKPKK